MSEEEKEATKANDELAIVSKNLGVPIACVVMTDDFSYSVGLEDGREITFNSTRDFMSQQRWRERLFEVAGAVLSVVPDDAWNYVLHVLAKHRVKEESAEDASGPVGILLRDMKPTTDRDDACRNGLPFTTGDDLWVPASAIPAGLRAGMRSAGFAPKQAAYYNLAGVRTNRCYWYGPKAPTEALINSESFCVDKKSAMETGVPFQDERGYYVSAGSLSGDERYKLKAMGFTPLPHPVTCRNADGTKSSRRYWFKPK